MDEITQWSTVVYHIAGTAAAVCTFVVAAFGLFKIVARLGAMHATAKLLLEHNEREHQTFSTKIGEHDTKLGEHRREIDDHEHRIGHVERKVGLE